MNKKLLGVVLAGGKSRRMGADKSMLQLSPESPTFLDIALQLLKSCGLDCAISAGSDSFEILSLRARGVAILVDCYSHSGPLGGIITSLKYAKQLRRDGILTLPCDTPLLTSNLLLRLIRAYDTQPPRFLVTAFNTPAEKIQINTSYKGPEKYQAALHNESAPKHPLVQRLISVWAVSALPLLETAFLQGIYSIKKVLPLEAWNLISCTPQEAMAFLNVNTPADLKLLKHAGEKNL